MKRRLPQRHFARPPLVVVLAQVRISPVLAMDTYIPQIQERFRRLGFPRFQKLQTQEVEFGPNGPSLAVSSRWEFQNVEKTWAIVLTPSTVTLETSDYATFENPFEGHLRRMIETVCSVAEPQYADRLGLRYVNLIGREKGKRFRDYLHAGFLGPPVEAVEVSDVLSTFISRGRTAMGTLIVRCAFVDDGSVLPPDLRAISLAVHPTVPDSADRVRAFLDLDHYSEDARAIDVDAFIKDFGRLHENTELAFDVATTDYAKNVWEDKLKTGVNHA